MVDNKISFVDIVRSGGWELKYIFGTFPNLSRTYEFHFNARTKIKFLQIKTIKFDIFDKLIYLYFWSKFKGGGEHCIPLVSLTFRVNIFSILHWFMDNCTFFFLIDEARRKMLVGTIVADPS